MAVQCSVYSDNGLLAAPVGSAAGDSTLGAAVSISGTQTEGFDNGDLVLFALASGDDAHTVTSIALTIGGVAQTLTIETKASTTSGNDGLMYYGRCVVSGITNGATAWVLTGTSSNTTTAYFSANVVRIREALSTSLVVQNAAHSQAAGSPTLTQIVNTGLVPADAAHTQAAGNVALVQQHTLVVNNARGDQAAGNVTLAQQHNLTVQSAAHSQAASSPGTFLQYSQLTVADARGNQAAGNVSLTQVHNLTVENARGNQAAGNVTLTQVHNLTPAGAAHSQTATSPTLVRNITLVVQNAQSTQTADGNLALFQQSPGSLTVPSTRHTQSATSPTLEQVITMTGVNNARHTLTSTVPTLQRVDQIAQVYGAVHNQKAGHVTLVQNSTLQVGGCRHYHEAHPIRLSQFAVAYLFVTPTVPSVVFTEERLVSYLRPPGGVTLLLEGGVVTEVQFPTQDQVSAADVAYIGGHQYTVTEQEAQVLRDAGYTANLYATVVEV
jgi:hypothetical protein